MTQVNSNVIVEEFVSFEQSVPRILDALEAGPFFARQKKILLKPNLVCASGHPVTTHPDFCEAMIRYIRSYGSPEIIIGEGTGDARRETDEIFAALGYTSLARRMQVALLDLNYAPLVRLENPHCPVFPEMHLPEVLFDSYVVSLPVLKVHSIADVTGTLKNMMGAAPPEYYSGRGGSWKKAVFHLQMDQSLLDLNRYRRPDMTVMDASIGMAEFHLGGPHCDPPIGKLLAGYEPWAVDRLGAELLGRDWRRIPYLAVGRERTDI